MKKIIKMIKKIRPYKGGGVALFQKDNATGEYTIFLGKRRGELRKGIRRFFSGRGKWSIPGGGYDEKDNGDLRQTAKREFHEETGLNIDDIVLSKEPYEHNIWLPFFTWKTLMYELKPDYKLNTNCIRSARDGFEFSEAKQITQSELKVIKHKHELNFGVGWEVKAFLKKVRK